MPDYTIRPTTMDDLLGFRTMQAKSWLATYPSPEHGVSHEWVKNRVDSSSFHYADTMPAVQMKRRGRV